MMRDRIRGIDSSPSPAPGVPSSAVSTARPRAAATSSSSSSRPHRRARGARRARSPRALPEEQRERALEAYEAADKGEARFLDENGEPTSRMTGQTVEQKLAAMADGGEDQ